MQTRGVLVASIFLLTISVGAAAPQSSKDESGARSSTRSGSPALKVCLRTEDGSAFIGVANVRVMPNEGYEVPGEPLGPDGEMIFADMMPGTYTVEASAAGFLAVRQKTQVEAGNRLQTLFLVMKPRLSPPGVAPPVPALSSAPVAPPKLTTAWIPPGIDDGVPNVQSGVECPLSQVVAGAGRRMKELIDNLQKFDATEHVEHFNVDAAGSRGKPEARTFDYVVVIMPLEAGSFELDEYRNGSTDPALFPAQVATTGLPGMALAFHPAMVSEFNLTCEGLGLWEGHPVWQVHFVQRPDRPNLLRVYVVQNKYYPAPLKGRAWIDASTYQIRHLESELLGPIPAIALMQEHIAIDYGQVQFRTHAQQLWLPLDAEVYWERRGHRFYRRHSFSDFKVFEVDSAQQIQAPEGSYCFKNTSDHDVTGILTVLPDSAVSSKSVAVRVMIASGHSVCKLVGVGKDVNIPADEIASASFRHNGLSGSITADVNLTKESVLDLIPESDVATTKLR